LEEPPFTPQNNDSKFYQDIFYGEFERNSFDIFLPPASDPTPVVVFVHSGGFTGGYKIIAYLNERYKQIINYLLSRNIAFASINYRYFGNR